MLAELKTQEGLDDFYNYFDNECYNANYLYNIYYKVFHPLTPAIPVTTTTTYLLILLSIADF